ncbi:MAG: ribulose-phosphate 3-epimerase [Cryobacterium sp.]|nr:ribulose-phosphate 3-epimerase [Cryobacterium sp.]
MKVKINPSILAADFVNLERDLQRISESDLVHIDVMDNHFVPNLTFGLQMVTRIQAVSPVPLDVHLMIEDPDRWALGYAELGAHSVTFHSEATEDPVALARNIRKTGVRAGVAVKPGTGVQELLPHLGEFDQVLVMTVEPGFGGQSFMEFVMPKVRAVNERRMLDRRDDLWLQVDGGIDATTIAIAAQAGADTFVAGTSVFREGEPNENIQKLREIAQIHQHS